MKPDQIETLLRSLGLGKVSHVERRRVVVALCPFHNDRVVPSLGFMTEYDGHPGNCFAGCFRGSLLSFVMQFLGVDRREAMRRIEEHGAYNTLPGRIPVEFERRFSRAPKAIKTYMMSPFWDRASLAYRWMRKHFGIDTRVSERARLGYMVDKGGVDRVMFPWFLGKKLVGVTGRAVDDPMWEIKTEPFFDTRKGDIVYLPFGKIDIETPLVLVEGEKDALKVASFGWDNVGAWGWSSPTVRQMDLVLRAGVRSVVTMGDNDDAGKRCNDKVELHMRGKCAVQKVLYTTEVDSPSDLDHEDFWSMLGKASIDALSRPATPPWMR